MRRQILLLTVIALLSTYAANRTATAAEQRASEIRDAVDEHVRPLIDNGAIVGCVVGVLKDGRQRVFGFGEVERGGGKKPNRRTIYEIGSITKAFTGTLLADMSLRGEVGLGDPLQEYVPAGVKAPQQGDTPITLAHLATHTSGLPRLPANMAPADPLNPYADYTPELAYAFLNAHELSRPPGTWDYSNYGMGLLGLVLSEHAGKPYEQLVVERVAKPLGMPDTRITLSSAQQKRLAPPYRGDLEPDRNWDLDALAGAGALRSTATDMLKLAAAAFSSSDKPIHRALRLAFEKREEIAGGSAIGLGWVIEPDGETRAHDGGTGGYRSVLMIHPPSKTAVVLLTNTAFEQATTTGGNLLAAMLGNPTAPVALRKEVEVKPAVLKAYAGKYEVAPGVLLTITLENGRLMAQLTGQAKAPIYAESRIRFFYKIVDAQITFNWDLEKRVVDGLVLHQFGRDTPAKRVDGAEPAQPRQEVAVVAATLKSYVGKYAITPSFVLNVTIEGDQLTVQATGQGKLPFYAESDTRFFCKLVDAQITFEQNARGVVDKLILHQNGRNQPAERIDDGKPQEPREEVAVVAATLKSYVGKYAITPTFALTVTLEDDQLMVRATGQSKFPVYAESETRFFYKAVDAQLTFEVGADGEVNKLTLHQNGRNLPGRRVPD